MDQAVLHRGDSAGLSDYQISRTTFVFDAFRPSEWLDTSVKKYASLIKAGVFPTKADAISKYDGFLVATEELRDTYVIDSSYGASNVLFQDVSSGAQICGVLIHTVLNPICHIGHATGLPLWTNGGDIQTFWNTGANKLFKWK